MIDDTVKNAVRELLKSKKHEYKKTFGLQDNDEEVFTVTIECKKRESITESMKIEARLYTISALPSGSKCACCGGSGRSS